VKAVLALALGLLLTAGGVVARQATPLFTCAAPSGYGVEVQPARYALDLQCQPALGETLEVAPGGSVRVTVTLGNYYAATGQTEASFAIHLAMDRANLVVREVERLQGEQVTDFMAALRDVPIITDQPSYSFIIENRGLRSAVFDLSVRPR
jgi:hypothetical protein